MNKDLTIESLAQLLPDREEDINFNHHAARQQAAEKLANKTAEKVNAAQLARLKLKEKRELEKLEKQKEDPTFGLTAAERKKYDAQQKRLQENIEEIEVIESSPAAQAFLGGGNSDMAPYAGTTQRDVVKLLSSLNINLNLYLSRADTYNLLSCLLTCNEAQLEGLMQNSKVPVAIKTVIKRLLLDMKDGNMVTVERLWDRVFGKADSVALNTLPGMQQTMPGLIPNTAVSREAYVIIRDTIIGK